MNLRDTTMYRKPISRRIKVSLIIIVFILFIMIAYIISPSQQVPPESTSTPDVVYDSATSYSPSPSCLNCSIIQLNPSADTTAIPLENKNQPLPHNALFIRRNNQFGTNLTVGISDLINQGV